MARRRSTPMKIAIAIAGGTAALGVTPAAAGVPTAAGCTFDRGKTTCVTVALGQSCNPPHASAAGVQVVTTTTVRYGAPNANGPVISTTDSINCVSLFA